MSTTRGKGTSEAAISQNIRAGATIETGAKLFRNQVGFYTLKDGRSFSSGLCKGSSDLIGWVPVCGVAVFTSIEVKKRGGRVSDQQESWINAVARDGGIADICYSEDEAFRSILAQKKAIEAKLRGR